MFHLTKKILVMTLLSSVNSLKCISMKNQVCKVREVIVNNKYMTYLYSVKVNRCNENCNDISNPYSRVLLEILLQKCLI